MSKGLIAFIAVACVAVIAAVIMYLKQTAHEARKRSDSILEQFQAIDKELGSTDVSLDSLHKTGFDSTRGADK